MEEPTRKPIKSAVGNAFMRSENNAANLQKFRADVGIGPYDVLASAFSNSKYPSISLFLDLQKLP